MEKNNEKVIVKTNTTGGIGFCGALTIAFVVLKLIGIIKWSWVWVLAPLWIPACISIGIMLIFGIILGIIALIQHIKGE